MGSQTETGAGIWTVPQCPFTIEYSLRVLDDIRLAVMDAFFSLPRGGAEIGGILLGRFADGRVIISDSVALDCEHAMGPSFTLSARDETKLGQLLAEVRKGRKGTPVGWYHSHTRSEVFLSDADVAIHQRFFPESWQVALVLKPHTFQPTRCGFFFRESNGDFHPAASYLEFTLDALPMRPVPIGERPSLGGGEEALPTLENPPEGAILVEPVQPEPTPKTVAPPTPAAKTTEPAPPPKVVELPPRAANVVDPPPPPKAVEIPPPPVPPPAPVEKAAPGPEPEKIVEKPKETRIEPPRLYMAEEQKPPRSRKGMAALGVCALLAIAVIARGQWWPHVSALFGSSSPAVAAAPTVGLVSTDSDGQLQIRWNRLAPAVLQATGGKLVIKDVHPTPREVKLDTTLLEAGSFTYAREGDSVTVELVLNEPDGIQRREATAFLGKLPAPRTASADPEIRKQRDAAAAEAASLKKALAAAADQNGKLRSDLATQVEHNKKLQKQLDDAHAQIRDQQRKRLVTQLPK